MELIKELLLEQRVYDIIDRKYYDELTEKEKKIKTYINTKMWKLIYDNIPQQENSDLVDLCEDAIENIFLDGCYTRLEVLKFALKLKNSCDIYDEINKYLDDDYYLEKWSEKSLGVYKFCLETYFSYYSDRIKKYKEIDQSARIGAYCFIERVAVETINTLAELAEDLGIEEDEEK